MYRTAITVCWLLAAGFLGVSCSHSPVDDATASVKSPTVGLVAAKGESKWVQTFRYTTIAASKEQVGVRPEFRSRTPHDMLCWARFNRMVPAPRGVAGGGGGAVESFEILVSGLTHNIQLDEEKIGDQMHGVLPLGEAGDCTLQMMSDEDYVIEVYSPSNPDFVPAEPPPVPKATRNELEEFGGQQMLDSQDWPAEKRALDKRVGDLIDQAQIAATKKALDKPKPH